MLATTPLPAVIDQVNVSNPNGTTDNLLDESAPSIAVDPSNPDRLVAAWSQYNRNPTTPVARLQVAVSNDGGATWSDPSSVLAPFGDPTTSNPVIPFTRVMDASVGIDPVGNVYVAARQTNAGGGAGVVVVQRFAFNGTSTGLTTVGGLRVVHEWDGDPQSAAQHVTLVVDTTPAAADAGFGLVHDNPYSGNVYVAWNTLDLAPTTGGDQLAPQAIYAVGSSDGGQSFTTPKQISASGFTRDTGTVTGPVGHRMPRMAVNPAPPSDPMNPVRGGRVSFVWEDFAAGTGPGTTPPFSVVEYDEASAALQQRFAGGGGAITPGATTDFPLDVTIDDPRFITIEDLDVELSITHPNVAQLQVVLVPPVGSGLADIPLINAGAATGASIGASPFAGSPGLVLDAQALSPLAAVATPTGYYRPSSPDLLAAVGGRTASQLGGLWTLRITAEANTSADPKVVNGWALRFNSGLAAGTDRQVATTPTLWGTTGLGGSIDTAASPININVSPVVAVDTTLGADSERSGRIYVAYTTRDDFTDNPADNTDIRLRYSDNGGVTWTSSALRNVNDDFGRRDGFSEASINSGRPQFMPEVAVDPVTGTLVVQFYDARHDAARARVATTVATSIDGGDSFSPQAFVNPQELVYDLSTDSFRSVGPIPDNQGGGNPNTEGTFAFGTRQGIDVRGGRIYSAWSSNINGALDGRGYLDIRVASSTTAVGPRIVDGTSGVVATTTDGTPEARQFDVTFDRLIDIATFSTDDVTIVGRRSDHSPLPTITATNVVPLDPVRLDPGNPASPIIGATRFRVFFPGQSTPGTYSYAVGPGIADVLGNLMDQDADATAGEAGVDRFAVPRTESGVPFGSPARDALPLIVPGPRVVGTQVVTLDGTIGDPADGPNLVLNGTVGAFEVTFDRDIQANTFGPEDVLRVVGPGGLVDPASYTVTPLGVSGGLTRTFRIGFDRQQLSGTYQLLLGSSIQSVNGYLVDSNANAGVDALRAGALQSPSIEVRYDSGDVPVALPIRQTVTSTIVIPENFEIRDLDLQLNISHTNVPDLSAELEGPDGTIVPLFAAVGDTGTSDDFSNTIFDDEADLPIGSGGPPFSSRFRPVGSLSNLDTTMAAGTYTLRITNNPAVDQAGVEGTLNSWRLILQRVVTGTGLGELVADRINADFRIFTMDPENGLSSSTWTAVGPASINEGGGAGRVTGLAVDPSDPSGNTVFAGGASGGVWKTNNFLTNDPEGPTWTPLLDQAATFGQNTGGITVFGRNSDPNQSIVFVSTGEGATFSQGVGLLRSMDGGRTWELLDSTDNTVPFAQRTHNLVGLTSFNVVVDPRPTPAGDAVVYAAFSARAQGDTRGGVYRSTDSGETWQQVLQGQATYVELDPTSGVVDPFTNPTGNLQTVFAALRGSGVFLSSAQGRAGSWRQMAGGAGKPQVLDLDLDPIVAVPTNPPVDTPNGAKGRIVLAKPPATGDPRGDLIYGGWLYAAVATTGGGFDGLYLTKDYGANWTKLRLPDLVRNPTQAIPTNDINNPDYTIFGTGNFAQGNFDIALTIDPTDPNVVYLGGTTNNQPTGLIRVDSRDVHDPHAFYLSSQLPGAGERRNYVSGPVSVEPTANDDPRDNFPFGNDPRLVGTVNLLRNPNDIFNAESTVFVNNAGRFSNTGAGVRWTPFDAVLQGTTDVHRAISFVDPVSGRGRLIFGDDQGLFTGVDAGDGTLLTSVGNNVLATGSRNGNIQITQLYYGAAQPSDLAAQIAGALFYGQAQDDGFPRSDPDILETGNLSWYGSFGDGTGVATDQTGSGTAYEYNWPCCGGNITGFFRVDLPDGVRGNSVGRTNGLLQVSNGSPVPDPQWPFLGGANFGVNPINRNEVVIAAPGSATAPAGRIFRTLDQGLNWFEIRQPSGSYTRALAFGSPTNPTTTITGDHILFGNDAGQVFVTYDGGANWAQINNGALAGNTSPVQVISPNPTPGSREAYAVTANGVFHTPDTQAGTWRSITGNVFQVTHEIFGDPDAVDTLIKPGNLKALAPDWRYVIPNNFDTPPTPPTDPAQTHPVLYVAGEGGVLVSYDDGASWSRFPSAFADSISTTPTPPGDGGGLPVADIRDLDLSLGNVQRSTGQPVAESNGATSPDLLTATTYGRGAYAIRLAPVVFPESLRLNLDGQRIPGGGAPPVLAPTDLVFTGYSARTAFANEISLQAFELDAGGQVVRQLTLNPSVGTRTRSDGSFTIQVDESEFPTEGLKRIGIQAVNQSGTEGNIAVYELIIDATPPAAPDRPDLVDASDTGASNFDNITSVRTPTFAITGVEAGSTVGLYRAGDPDPVASGVVPAGLDRIQLTDPGLDTNDDGILDGLPDGTYLYSAVQIDAVGNASDPSLQLEVIVTDEDPTIDPDVPDLVAASDSGRSNTDNITNVTSPTFQLNGQAGQPIELLRKPGGAPSAEYVVVGSITGPGMITDAGALLDGIYDYAARRNGVAVSLPLAVLIDTVAPGSPGVPDLNPDSDTGVSNTDDLTNNTTPGFTVSGVEPDAEVRLLRDGLLVGTSAPAGPTGVVTVADSGAPNDVEATYAYTAEQVDVAGNLSVAGGGLDVTIDPIAPDAPQAPDLQAASDTGTSNIDNLTAVTSPTFTVSGVEQGARIRLLRNGAVVSESAPAGAGGSVTVNDPGPVPDGRYVYTALQIDPAGNVGLASPGLTVTIDTRVLAPARPDLRAASDTGISDTDNITSATAPVFDIGGIEFNPDAPTAPVAVRLLRNGVVVNTASLIGGGVVSITDPGPVPGGVHSYTAVQVDAAGNISPAGPGLTVTIDLTLPVAPARPDLQAGSDTGLSNTDNLTSDRTPTFDVAGAEAGARVRLFRRLVGSGSAAVQVAEVVAAAAGTVVLTDPGPDLDNDGTPDGVPDGVYDYTAIQVDVAGNVGPAGPALTVTIDGTADAMPAAPDLRAASDTGISNTDNITRDTAPSFDVGGLATSSTITVRIFRELVGSGSPVLVNQVTTVATGGQITLPDPGPVPDGQYNYTAVQVDAAGNASLPSAALVVTIDTVPPPATDRPDLQMASDDGASNFDNITSRRVLTFDVTGVTPGSQLQLLRGGTPVGTPVVDGDGDGRVTITDPGQVPLGTHVYTVRQVDAAGNAGADSPGLEVIVTNQDPTTDPNRPDLIDASDSGRSQTDNITRVTTPTFEVAALPGQLVELFRKPAGNPSADYVKVGEVTGPGQITNTTPLADGIYDFAARRGGMGNPFSLPLAVQIDNTAPDATDAPVLEPGSDTPPAGDNITEDKTPAFTISGIEPNAEVSLYRRNTADPNALPVLVGSVISDSGGTVTITEPADVPNGVYDYTAIQVDAADNSSVASEALRVTIAADIAAPNPPDLLASTDTGASDSDDVTQAAAGQLPRFEITGAEPGFVVRLLRRPMGGMTYVEVARGTANAQGVAILADPGPFADGTFEYAADQSFTDLVTGAVSGALVVTIDNTSPASSSTPDLTAASDTGISDTDNLTADPNPTFRVTGVEPGATVRLLRDGLLVVESAPADSSGVVELADPGDLGTGRVPDGLHSYRAIVVDPAGNTSPATLGLAVTIDSVPPSGIPDVPDLQAGSDTGSNSADDITSATAATFDLSGVPGASRVELLRDGVVVASRVGDGPVTDPGPIPEGVVSYTARLVDAAGNVGTPSAPRPVTFDRTPPAAAGAPVLQAGSDTGTVGDNLTADPSPTFDVSGVAPNTLVRLLRDGVPVAEVFSAAGGTVALTDPGPVPDGSFSYTSATVDLAGNVGPASPGLTVTVLRALPPAPPAPVLQAGSDTGAVGDNITSAPSLTFDASGVPDGLTVQLLRGGQLIASRVGPGPIADPGPVPDGTFGYALRLVDAAGNVGPAGSSLTVVVDSQAPPAPIAPVLQLGSDTGAVGDNITSDPRPTFDALGIEAGAAVQLLRDGVVVTTRAGSGAITDPGPLPPGTYSYSLRQVDAAGNVGPAGPATAITIVLAPAGVPSAPDLAEASDTGRSSTDGVTNDTSPTFLLSGVPAGQAVQLLRDGEVVASRVGPGPITDPGPLADGSFSYSARFLGVGSIPGQPGPGSAIEVDTLAPTAPPRPSLLSGAELGEPVFLAAGVEADASVELLRDGVVVASRVGPGPIADPGPVPPGSYSYALRQADLAGNVGPNSGPLGVQVGPEVEPSRAPADFDGDGITDLATYTVVDGVGRFEYIRSSDGSSRAVTLGGTGDFPVAGDYDGDGLTDPAVYGFDPSIGAGRFLILQSSDGLTRTVSFGGEADFPVAGDYDGDGTTDIAVYGFSPNNGFSRFGIILSGGGVITQPFGGEADFPVAGDYDGDGTTDIAVYGFSPNNGFSRFGIIPSSGSPTLTVPFGGEADAPIAGDFDGDGRTDLAVYGFSPNNGFSRFGVVFSSGEPTLTQPFGGADDSPVAGDFDGDGRTDLAVYGFSPNNGFSRFGIIPSAGGATIVQAAGTADSIGLPPFSGLFQATPTSPTGVGTAARVAGQATDRVARLASPAGLPAGLTDPRAASRSTPADPAPADSGRRLDRGGLAARMAARRRLLQESARPAGPAHRLAPMVDPGIDANRPEDGPDAALSEAIERFGPLRLARLLFRRGRRD